MSSFSTPPCPIFMAYSLSTFNILYKYVSMGPLINPIKALVKCELECGLELQNRDVYLHLLKDCPKRMVPCPRLCNIGKLRAEEVENHMQDLCAERYKECPLGCGIQLRLADMDLHTSKNCPKIRTGCCYVGCAVLASLVPQHERDHLSKPCKYFIT